MSYDMIDDPVVVHILSFYINFISGLVDEDFMISNIFFKTETEI